MLTMKSIPTTNGLTWTGVGVRLNGTNANETLNGSAFADEIHGGGGRDYINGGGGNDLLFGEIGNDQLNGGSGNDTLDGGADNDTLIGGAGADLLFGGAGFDVASYLTATVGVSIDVAAGGLTNDAAGDRYNSIERFVGSNFGDIMNGDSANNDFDGGLGEDWLFGNGGNDLLFAGGGNDHVRGGDGDDIIEGGTGIDVLTGNAGADVFVFRASDSWCRHHHRFPCRESIASKSTSATTRSGMTASWRMENSGTNSRPGHYRNTHFSNLDSSDKLSSTTTRKSSIRSIRSSSTVELAALQCGTHRDVPVQTGSVHVGTGDFFCVMPIGTLGS